MKAGSGKRNEEHSKLLEAMAAIETDRSHLEALFDVMPTGILFLDSADRVIYCNQAYRALWGLPADALLAGELAVALTDRTAWLRVDDHAYRAHLHEIISKKSGSGPFEIQLRNGQVLSETSRLVNGSENQPIGRVWLFEDVTDQRAAEAKLIELAERDSLTGLYNRRHFEAELDRLLAEASRRNTQLGLMIFDLNEFKYINDRFGHKAGDEVLIALSNGVDTVIRRNEKLCRVGGDEFALLVPDTQLSELKGLVERILSYVDTLSFYFDGTETHIAVSVGIALYPEHAVNAEALMQCADAAMYLAKAGGGKRQERDRSGHRCELFDPQKSPIFALSPDN